MDKSVQEIYGNRLRIRVCGICRQKDSLLLVNHAGLREGAFWAPPGGGMEFGQSAKDNLIREFREETGLVVSPGSFLFSTEFIRDPLHAVELFFEVSIRDGALQLGRDPEMGDSNQALRDVKFMTFEEIDKLPANEKHGAFGLSGGAGRIGELKGYFQI